MMEQCLEYIPSVLFYTGYLLLMGDCLLNNRMRRAPGFRGLLFVILGSQAYQLWSNIEIYIRGIAFICIENQMKLVELLILLGISSIPLWICGLQWVRSRLQEWRHGQGRRSWRSRAERTELGTGGYFLRPDVPHLLLHRQRQDPHWTLVRRRRIRSQTRERIMNTAAARRTSVRVRLSKSK